MANGDALEQTHIKFEVGAFVFYISLNSQTIQLAIVQNVSGLKLKHAAAGIAVFNHCMLCTIAESRCL